MKMITLSLLFIIILTSTHGWAQNSSIATPDEPTGTQNKIDDLFSNFGQKVHSQIHALTNECMRDVTQIPSDQKTKWCQEQKQKKIEQLQQQIDRMKTMGRNSNLYWDQQVKQIKDDLDRCQYIADSILIERCSTFEKNINMNLMGLSDSNTYTY